MFLYSKTAKAILDAWPGKRKFGLYRFMPLFFLLGAALEFSMINWHVGEVNFYKVYKKRKITEALKEEAIINSTTGVSWTTYLKYFSASMIFMMAGAQSVHLVYRPLEDLDKIIEKEKTRKTYKQDPNKDTS